MSACCIRRASQVALAQGDEQRVLRIRTQLKGLHFEALGADLHRVYNICRVPMLRTPREWAALKWWPFGTADVEKVRGPADLYRLRGLPVGFHRLPLDPSARPAVSKPVICCAIAADAFVVCRPHPCVADASPACGREGEGTSPKRAMRNCHARLPTLGCRFCTDVALRRSPSVCSATSWGSWGTTSSCTPSCLREI